MVAASAVEVEGISKRFDDQVALRSIDLSVRDGEFISLLGPSGCGKTTLLRIISGFERPDIGRVRIHGRDVTDLPPHRRPTNIVFQRGALFPHMNVAENIGYSLRLRGWPRDRIAAKVNEMLALVRLDGLGRRGPTELSGGQIQRAALARALAAEPTVLLLDEPLSALDLKLRQHMQLELRAIHQTLGATFVYVTHDQTEAMVMSDRIVVLNAGRMVQVGTPREIYTNPVDVFASDFIGATNLLRGTVKQQSGSHVEVDLGGFVMPGRSALRLHPGAAVTLSVRPESVRLGAADDDSARPPGPRATIRRIVYLGSSLRVDLVAGDVAMWADTRELMGGLQEGAQVAFDWSETAAPVWPGDAERSEADA